jgi:hypothetical protein
MSQISIPSSNTIPASTTNEGSGSVKEFNNLFDPGKRYTSLALLRSTIADYGQRYNIVMSTKNSNYRSVHLWCKHAGVYRKGKKRNNSEKSNENENTPTTKVIKSRKKETQRTDCKCYIKAKLIGELWVIEHSHGEHNHAIPKNKTVYSLHRRQTDEIKTLILQLLNNGQKISAILEYLHMIGINNIIKKDIENLQQQFRRKKKLNIKQDGQEKISTTVASFPIVMPTAPSPALDQIPNHHRQYSSTFDHQPQQPQQQQQENTHMLYPSTTTTTADLIPDIISSYTNHTPTSDPIIKEQILLNTSTSSATVEDIVESIEITQK